jgi:hypothetical protein
VPAGACCAEVGVFVLLGVEDIDELRAAMQESLQVTAGDFVTIGAPTRRSIGAAEAEPSERVIVLPSSLMILAAPRRRTSAR